MSLSLQEVSLSGHGLRLPGKGTERPDKDTTSLGYNLFPVKRSGTHTIELANLEEL